MGWKRRPPAGNVRRVVAITNNLRGTITNKTGHIVQYESFAERSLLLHLERDRTVRDYASQPETFVFAAPDGRMHRYTPDFIVWRTTDHIEIHEVTLSHRTDRLSQQWRMQAAEQICRARAWQYMVHTEHTLPQGAELANLQVLHAYRPTGYADEQVQAWLEQHLPLDEPYTFGQIAQTIAADMGQAATMIYPCLYHELWYDRLQMDWQRLFIMNGGPVQSTLVVRQEV
ncbi:MAG: hypothetical protein GX573_08485 [Chloroflexi bacterium]|nr:hypothetical protein [Chloroflexota bacterium]